MERRTNRPLLGALAAIFIAAIASLATYQYLFSPVTIEGVVDHKAVTGVKEDTIYSILLNTPEGIMVEDEDFKPFFFADDKNAVINKALENEMKTEYPEIRYLVSIRLTTEDPVNNIKRGETLAYFVSRADFNSAEIGATLRCEVSRSLTATIENMIVLAKP